MRKSSKRQLDYWVAGKSIHNLETDECCPDFSCCTGRIAPKSERVKFMMAAYNRDEEQVNNLCFGFLAKSLTASGYQVVTRNGVYSE